MSEMHPPPSVHTANLTALEAALKVIDEQADLNERYRRMLRDCRGLLGTDEIRLTQARGIAKKLIVLARAAGSEWRETLRTEDEETVRSGLTRADELIYQSR